MVVEVEVEADTVEAAVVLDAGGAASPEAGVDPVPAADPATADQDPSRTPVHVPNPAHHAGASRNRLPGPVQDPSQSPALGVTLPDQTKGPNQDLEADP